MVIQPYTGQVLPNVLSSKCLREPTPAPPTHRARLDRMQEMPLHKLAEGLPVAARETVAGDSMLDEVVGGTEIRGDRRHAALHRLEGGHSESLESRREDEEVRAVHAGKHIGVFCAAHHAHAAAQRQAVDQGAELVFQGAVAVVNVLQRPVALPSKVGQHGAMWASPFPPRVVHSLQS